MADLFNNWPSWGETGSYPSDGFFYEGGDQVNEKHQDALWNGLDSHVSNINTAIRDRVRDLSGDTVLDGGLHASTGSGTREVDVTASSAGAYVDGQRTGSTSATTLTHTTNGSGSLRTDVVWVDVDGNVGKTEGTTSVSNDRHKIAEVDVNTSDAIDDVRNTGRDHVDHVAIETQPTGSAGDMWHDLTSDRVNVYQNVGWRTLLTEQDDVTINANDGLSGTETEDLVGGADFSFAVVVSDLIGTGVTADGSNNVELDESVIKDGGAKEIDLQEFSGSDGAAGETVITDGNDVRWDNSPNIPVSEDGTEILNSPGDLNFTNGLSVTDDGDGTVSVDADEAVRASNYVFNQ